MKADNHSLTTGREKVARARRSALDAKYAAAVERYASTDESLQTIASACGVSAGGLGSYLRRYRRELVLQRHHFPLSGQDPYAVKLCAAGQQSPQAQAKYKDAVAACASREYIGMNISQVAREFNVSGAALSNFLKVHYPDILAARERARCRLGLADRQQRGVRAASNARYAQAVELYRTTEQTLPQIAEACNVSLSGLLQHLRFYHKDVLRLKGEQRRRAQAVTRKERGSLLGNGRRHEPAPATERKYAVALELYRDTTLTLREIVRRTGVPAEGFRFYLHKWHKPLVDSRAARLAGKPAAHLSARARALVAKYAPAVASLRRQLRPIARVAAEFGFHPETFRAYLQKYVPDLARQLGRTVDDRGNVVSCRSQAKYAEAIRCYVATSDSLLSIARRMGLNYTSLGSYMRRNYPDLLRRRSSADKARPAAGLPSATSIDNVTSLLNNTSWAEAAQGN